MLNPINTEQKMLEIQNQKFADLAQKANGATDAEARAASEGFEAIFVKMMLNELNNTLEKGLFGDQPGADFYQDMFFDEIAQQISKNGDIGLADSIYEQIRPSEPAQFDGVRSIDASDRIFVPKHIQKEANADLDQLPNILSNRLKKYQNFVSEASEKFGVDEAMIYSIISQESYGNPKAESPVGAKGLMQLMDATAKDMGVKNSFSIRENILGGTKYYKKMLNKYEDTDLALAAYNAGPANVDKYNGIPPFKETQTYVKRVQSYFKKMQQGD